MSDCFVLYLLLTCMKKKTSGADKFTNNKMIQVSSKRTPRHPSFRAYYEKCKAEGKTSQQVLICISRRLISIIYGMLKSGTEYHMPVVESTGENI